MIMQQRTNPTFSAGLRDPADSIQIGVCAVGECLRQSGNQVHHERCRSPIDGPLQAVARAIIAVAALRQRIAEARQPVQVVAGSSPSVPS
jgi:coenzyme F420-reducing hydrogenase delta subunit